MRITELKLEGLKIQIIGNKNSNRFFKLQEWQRNLLDKVRDLNNYIEKLNEQWITYDK